MNIFIYDEFREFQKTGLKQVNVGKNIKKFLNKKIKVKYSKVLISLN